jgi:Tfp pilus assembly protein PilO
MNRADNQRLTLVVSDQENSLGVERSENKRLSETINDQQNRITSLSGYKSQVNVLSNQVEAQ